MRLLHIPTATSYTVLVLPELCAIDAPYIIVEYYPSDPDSNLCWAYTPTNAIFNKCLLTSENLIRASRFLSVILVAGRHEFMEIE